jgi:hypothetical protein
MHPDRVRRSLQLRLRTLAVVGAVAVVGTGIVVANSSNSPSATTAAPANDATTTTTGSSPWPDFYTINSDVTCDRVFEHVRGLSEGGSVGSWSWGPVVNQTNILVWDFPREARCMFRNPEERAEVTQANGSVVRALMLVGFDLLRADGGDGEVDVLRRTKDDFLARHEQWVTECQTWVDQGAGDCAQTLEVSTDTETRFVAESRFYQTDPSVPDAMAATLAVVIEEMGPVIVVVEWRIGGECPPAYQNGAGEWVSNEGCVMDYFMPPTSVPSAISLADGIRNVILDL